ncbi:hypothetical protein BEP19_05215 [Ammoniphilus oxalaticus]|uniref:O-antigen ligase-related domain-containing protein n=1 Tax=Ammoniphilus oxalaticus TaxID=66863 RepID=A0A419SIQ0_9BACL|nr:O-antigen ligase family protein [Ammoniphilus oxalaticus]RKD23830.1 hypothetical protein BEP19_05215 [Ammoniphilus oxalaticus]
MSKNRVLFFILPIFLFGLGLVQFKAALIGEVAMLAAFLLITLYRAEYGLYLFALTLPILTYRPLLAFILMILLLFFVQRPNVEQWKERLRNHLNVAVFLFLIALFISAITSANLMLSMKDFGLYFAISFLLYLLIVLQIGRRETLYRFMVLLILSTTLVSVYGIFQYFTLDFTSAKWGTDKRAFATFGNPNIFAQYLIMILPFAFAFIFYAKTWGNRVLFAGQFLVIFLALLLTFSRGGWVAIFVAIALLAAMISRRLLVVGMIGGAIGVNFLPASIINRISTIASPGTDTSASYRFEMWKSALAMIRDFWVTGIGLDSETFLKVYSDYMMPDVRVFHFHNIFLMSLVTGGILSFLTLMYMFYQSARTTVSSLYLNKNYAKDPLLSIVAKAAVCSVIAIGIAGLTEDVWRQYRVDFLFWMVLAIISVVYNFARKGSEQAQ